MTGDVLGVLRYMPNALPAVTAPSRPARQTVGAAPRTPSRHDEAIERWIQSLIGSLSEQWHREQEAIHQAQILAAREAREAREAEGRRKLSTGMSRAAITARYVEAGDNLRFARCSREEIVERLYHVALTHTSREVCLAVLVSPRDTIVDVPILGIGTSSNVDWEREDLVGHVSRPDVAQVYMLHTHPTRGGCEPSREDLKVWRETEGDVAPTGRTILDMLILCAGEATWYSHRDRETHALVDYREAGRAVAASRRTRAKR